MENKCYFVCSRGILKSCSFHSLNPTYSCSNDSSYLYSMLESNEKFDGMSIYLYSDLLRFFVNNILDKIHNKFILVTCDFIDCNYCGRFRLDYIPRNLLLENIRFSRKINFTQNKEDCEHRFFHFQAVIKNKAKIRISPFCLFI